MTRSTLHRTAAEPIGETPTAASEKSYTERLLSDNGTMEFALFRIEAVCKALEAELGEKPSSNEQASMLASVITTLSKRALIDIGGR